MKKLCLIIALLLLGSSPARADDPPQEEVAAQVLPPRLPGTGLMYAGVSLFASGYAAAYMTGTLLFSFELESHIRSSSPSRDQRLLIGSALLWIPVAGPLASAIAAREPAWSIPWAIIGSGLQVSGFALMIQGARMRERAKASRVQLLPAGSGVMLAGSF